MMKKMMLVLCVAALGMGMAASAEETQTEKATEAVSEAVTEAVSEKETEAADVVESFLLQIEGKDAIEVKNTAKLDVKAVSVELQENEEKINVTLAAKDGQTYEFEDVLYLDMQEPELIKQGAFYIIRYTGIASGEERKAGQTGELKYDKPAELFATDDVYIRSEPNDESEIVGMLNRGDAIEVLGETARHFIVKKDDVTGYSVRRCISEDEQEALAAVEAEAQAQAAIRAQQAAEQAASQDYYEEPSAPAVYEVKRQKFDDCDGSGHGYYEITYSDGTTAIEEY